MVLETEPLAFSDWLPDALVAWVVLCAILLALVFLAATVRAMLQHGVSRGFERLAGELVGIVQDLWALSPRRVWALARLAVQESLGRRAVAGLVVYVVILSFALWFLDAESPDPARLYTSFVLSATGFLVLVMSAVLSVFSLPEDLKNKTIQTVVTKPVRASEVVLGRILGFSLVGTVLLALMGVGSYLFVVRSIDHTHQFAPDESRGAESSQESGTIARLGHTSTDQGHRHQVLVYPDGTLETDMSHGHWHPVHKEGTADRPRYVVEGPSGQFHARVPQYGKLRFKDRTGHDARKGINVGYEWTYRSWIEGGTLQAAIWRFEKLHPENFPEGLPLDLTIRVFRTYKGEIEQGIVGSLVLRNPRTGASSAPRDFKAKEFTTDRHLIPRNLTDASGRSLDLFKDLVADGTLDIELTCLQSQQFFGMAQPDLYLLAREASVGLNFLKGYLGIWLQVCVITAVGIFWSTFLSGAVALLATIATLVGGLPTVLHFIQDLAAGTTIGGGTFESAVRIFEHKSSTIELEEGWSTTVVGWLDWCVRGIMYLISKLLPDLGGLGSANYVAEGFDIPFDRLAVQMVSAGGYVMVAFLLGFIFFRSREVAR